MIESQNFQFLVLGAGRGGTSLLACLLDQHSMLEVGFELFSVDYLMGRALPHEKPSTVLFDRMDRFKSACLAEAKKYPQKIWGNKITTEQLYGLEDHNKIDSNSKIGMLDFFFKKTIPEVKILFILRDGRTCIRSKINRTGQPLEQAIFRWKYSIHVYQWLKEYHLNQIIIKYEDLLKEPVVELNKVCRFLDVPFESTMLQGTNNSKMPLEYRSHYIDRSKLDYNDLPEIYSMIKEELKYCGYV